MGSLGGKTKTTQTQNSTTTPTAPGWLQGPFQNYYGSVNGLMGTPPTGAGAGGASDIQRQVYATAPGLLAGHEPSGYNANGYNASGVDVGQLANTDLSPYMNPFTNEVIDRSLGDLERGRQGAITGGQAAATQAGAYGGSRHGVADSLTNREFADSAGNLSANLRSQGFLNAQQGALTDIGNRFSADQFNSGAMNTMGQFNAGAMNDAAQFNANAMNGRDANNRANLGLLSLLGDSQRDTNMASDPQQQQAAWLAQMQSLLGLNPNAFIGNNSTGTATGTQSSNPGLAGLLGTGANIASLFMKSDRRLKRDAEFVGEDERGLRWWRYRYIWDEPGTVRHGVMADETDPQFVKRDTDGYFMVDYGRLLAGAL